MKTIKVKVHENGLYVRLTLPEVTDIYLCKKTILDVLDKNLYHIVFIDGYYTVRINPDKIYIWREEHIVYKENINGIHFLRSLVKIANGIETNFKFSSIRSKDETKSYITWAEIYKSDQFTPYAKDVMKNIVKDKRHLLKNVKEKISHLLSQGKTIYSDSKYSFYFDQRDETGKRIGYNGGLIYHERSDSYSIHT